MKFVFAVNGRMLIGALMFVFTEPLVKIHTLFCGWRTQTNFVSSQVFVVFMYKGHIGKVGLISLNLIYLIHLYFYFEISISKKYVHYSPVWSNMTLIKYELVVPNRSKVQKKLLFFLILQSWIFKTGLNRKLDFFFFFETNRSVEA